MSITCSNWWHGWFKKTPVRVSMGKYFEAIVPVVDIAIVDNAENVAHFFTQPLANLQAFVDNFSLTT